MNSQHSTSDTATSESLLERAKQSEPEAWEQLCALYGPLVYHWIRHGGVPESDAPDLFQEVFQSVVKSLPSFRRDRPGDRFRGWLFTITRRKVIDHFRRNARQVTPKGGTDFYQRMQELPDEEDPSTVSQLANEGPNLFHRALELIKAEFEQRTWDAFWKTSIENQSVKDVAELLQMSTDAVYQARSRILRRMRHEFGELLT